MSNYNPQNIYERDQNILVKFLPAVCPDLLLINFKDFFFIVAVLHVANCYSTVSFWKYINLTFCKKTRLF